MKKMGPVELGDDVYIHGSVILGHPGKDSVETLFDEEYEDLQVVKVGDGVLLRAFTVLYEGVELGEEVKTGHHVLIREKSKVGSGTVVGSGSIIEAGCSVGKRVSIQSDVYLSSGTVVEDDVFLGPKVCMVNDRYIDSDIKPVVVRKGAKIGANSTIIAGVEIGEGAFVGAGAVVTKEVPAGDRVAGVPAKRID